MVKSRVFKSSALISWFSDFISYLSLSLSTSLITYINYNITCVPTVEHLLSALEGTCVDNCRIEIVNSNNNDTSVEVPIFDGSAREWVEAIGKVGLTVATDCDGGSCDKLAPYLTQPVHVSKGDSVLSAFPSTETSISYGINFPQVPALSLESFSSVFSTDSFYSKQIAPSRTFCIYEVVEKMRSAGLIKGGSAENAVVFR